MCEGEVVVVYIFIQWRKDRSGFDARRLFIER